MLLDSHEPLPDALAPNDFPFHDVVLILSQSGVFVEHEPIALAGPLPPQQLPFLQVIFESLDHLHAPEERLVAPLLRLLYCHELLAKILFTSDLPIFLGFLLRQKRIEIPEVLGLDGQEQEFKDLLRL